VNLGNEREGTGAVEGDRVCWDSGVTIVAFSKGGPRDCPT
jgi:hypothetical protein